MSEGDRDGQAAGADVDDARLGRGRCLRGPGVGDIDLAHPAELLDEGKPCRVVHLDAAEDDGVVPGTREKPG